jgi:polysaccharide export outer membrane protein
VKEPGTRKQARNSNVLDALSSAGGVTLQASVSHVKIRHSDGTEETVNLVPTLINGDDPVAPKTRQGDVVVVPLAIAQYAVLGYVAAPGTFAYPEGKDLTLADAIASARGHDNEKRARMSRVGIARVVNGVPEHKIYDFGKFLTGGDAKNNPVIKPGDVIYVPETDKIDLRTILSGISSAGLLWRAAK